MNLGSLRTPFGMDEMRPNDPRDRSQIDDDTWSRFCEEAEIEPTDIEEMEERLEEDEELGVEFDEWLAGEY